MATYIPVTNTATQFVDNNGDTLVGGSLEFFEAGTSTPTDLFTSDGTSIGTSIELNAWGYPESGGMAIFLFRDQSKGLKIVVKNAAGAVVGPTMDYIPAVASFDSTSAAKLDLITVTAAVDLDTVVADLATAYQVDGSVALTADVTLAAGTFLNDSVTAGITASTTQTQGEGALISALNEVSTCANTNDTVTLPETVAGRPVTVINNGAETLQIFPPVSSFIDGLAVDTATTLDAGSTQIFKAYSATQWESVITTPESTDDLENYASMYDEANGTAYTINAQTDVHLYHILGMADGGSLGWTFDNGGAGVPIAIASIADGADSGVDIAVTTTGNHGLTAGDVISQTNLASAVYTGVFMVKAIINNTIYEVEAVYTATDTGMMDAAATLTADAGSAGTYAMSWSCSATSASSSEVFDWNIYLNAAAIIGSSVRRKFGTGGDIGSMSVATPPFDVVAGDKLSLAFANNDSAGNLTIRNTVLTLFELI